MENGITTNSDLALIKELTQNNKNNKATSKKSGFWETAGETLVDFSTLGLKGIAKGVENIIDAGATGIGLVGGLFNSGFKREISNFVKDDYVGEAYDNLLGSFTDDSLLEKYDWTRKYVKGTIESVGEMLPSIAVGVATGGVGSMPTFGVQAFGGATENKLNEGYGLNQSALYGVGDAVVETGVEMLTGGIGGSSVGKSLIKNTAKTTGAKIGLNMLGEGAEEVIGDLIKPIWAKVSLGEDISYDINEIKDDFIVGALSAGVIGGSIKAVDVAKYGREGSFVNDSLTSLVELTSHEQTLIKNGKLNEQGAKEIASIRKGLTNDIQTTLESLRENNPSKFEKLLNSKKKALNEVANIDTESLAKDKATNQETQIKAETKADTNSIKTEVEKMFVKTTTNENGDIISTKSSIGKNVATYVNENVEQEVITKATNQIEQEYQSEIAGMNAKNKARFVNDKVVKSILSNDILSSKEAINKLVSINPKLANSLYNKIPNDYRFSTIKNMFEEALNLPISTTPKSKQQIIDESKNKVLTEITVDSKSYRETIKEDIVHLQNNLTNAQAGVELAMKKVGVKNADVYTNFARVSRSQADQMISGVGQFSPGFEEKEGSSLYAIMKEVKQEDRQEFYQYMYHVHNIDRMSIEARFKPTKQMMLEAKSEVIKNTNKLKALKEQKAPKEDIRNATLDLQVADEKFKKLNHKYKTIKNKPVFSEEVSSTISEDFAAEYEKLHPDYINTAEKLWRYNDNLLRQQLHNGIISEEQYNTIKEYYPHYVPTYRQIGKINGTSGLTGNISIDGTKKAIGSELSILPLDVQMARETMRVMNMVQKNALAKELYLATQDKTSQTEAKQAEQSTDFLDEIDNQTEVEGTMFEQKKENGRYSLKLYIKGEKVEMDIDKNTFDSFDNYRKSTTFNSKILNVPSKVVNLFKRLVTDLNPVFLVRNAVKDFQDAGLYTKNPKTFFKNFPRAYKEMASNSKLWQLYKASGAMFSSNFDFNKAYNVNKRGELKQKSIWARANMAVEQAPRFAEFISTYEKTEGNIKQAVLDANDITVNFGRGGVITKRINNAFVPFLNAQIQGFSKLYRVIVSKKSLAQWGLLISKATLIGITPAILNALIYKDDDEYKNLRQSDKDNFFLLKVNGNFFKLPKGRALSVISGFFTRPLTSPNNDSLDDIYDGYIENAWNQISPVNTSADGSIRTILSPINDIKANTTWYGGSIENQAMQNLAPKNRFDDSTSKIAIALGKVLNYSPKKINYLIDQYSGVLGDILLPLTTSKSMANPFTSNFIIDPNSSNSLGTQFNKVLKKELYNKNDINLSLDNQDDYKNLLVSKGAYKYLNNIKSTISDMQKQIASIQADNSISNSEKNKQSSAIYSLINSSYKQALDNVEQLKTNLYNSVDISLGENPEAPDLFEENYIEAYRQTFGTQLALKNFFSDSIYNNAIQLNSSFNIPLDYFYSFYIDTKDLNKQLTLKYIFNSKSLSLKQKYALIRFKGYSTNIISTFSPSLS